MKKKLRNVLLSTLALSTGIAFSQTIVFDSNSNNGTVVSGPSVTQTIEDGSLYVLTATHSPDGNQPNSGAALWDLETDDQAFFYESPQSGGGSWEISLTKDGASQTFTLNQIDFVNFNQSSSQTIQFKGFKDGNEIVIDTTDETPAAPNSNGVPVSFTFTTNNDNNTNLSSFTISTPDNNLNTQLIDFHNISITIPSETLSVEEEKDNDSFKVTAAPNPTTDKVTIKFNNAITTENEFNILDMNGRLIKSQKSNKLQETIDLSSFKSGVYFVKISNEKYIKTLRLIKK
ncbi:T9SS type A sorting domain-containing protein [Flavivirga jejuensis]|uniref:T9SS type A sorting domain-containing protein n=1 Tax=Flavivirga jejuensis TaxID=870487 RepID=A0ABT8WSL1_9FLAO|nr:T9SS type A sorting domain-containing protein [Flavivirga jejuensis]MDO5976158.1 T9SS type A sorting domain-containing protein [Flavivirga jejuensis]